ncbi:hypothetical protein SAMN04515674_101504 [Pseudarcicella hirudinis]|uniref:Uncharacterized protein n=2 Tax=Pseudarcicella hirudinis TaxID=1079859 RepID=A0A1I5MY14_9BACT|nr:hypothetical protein [Pseudarcicella hirudinis]SFP14413.1 hypothetical protein SAMN04515674_101504 [Pseudarcicella hirudinis]
MEVFKQYTENELEKLRVNYLELSLITGIRTAEGRAVFALVLKKFDPSYIKASDYLFVKDLLPFFIRFPSVDERFDNKSELILRLMGFHRQYRHYLQSKACIKRCMLTGAKKVFYNLMSEQEKKHCEKALKSSHICLYGEKSYNEAIQRRAYKNPGGNLYKNAPERLAK